MGCRRQYLLRHLLGLPEIDLDDSGTFGSLVHDLLRVIHETGSCHDEVLVGEVVDSNAGEFGPAARACIERHRTRCPSETSIGHHEIAVARFGGAGVPLFIATAQIDALWIGESTLIACDYKTGRSGIERVADSLAARVQAWILARHASRKNLNLRLQYEYLGAGVTADPEPFEPEDEDLETIRLELHEIVAEISTESIAWEDKEATAFPGISLASFCMRCGYRSICTDAQVTAMERR